MSASDLEVGDECWVRPIVWPKRNAVWLPAMILDKAGSRLYVRRYLGNINPEWVDAWRVLPFDHFEKLRYEKKLKKWKLWNPDQLDLFR